MLKSLQQSLTYIWRACLLVLTSAGPAFLLRLALLIATALLPLAFFALTRRLVDGLQLGETTLLLCTYLAVMFVVVLAGDFLEALDRWLGFKFNWKLQDGIYHLMQKKSSSLELEYYENTNFHQSLHMAQVYGAERPVAVVDQCLVCLQLLVSQLGILILLGTISWWIPLFFLLALSPALLIHLFTSGKIRFRLRSWSDDERKADYMHHALTHRDHSKELRNYSLAASFLGRFARYRKSFYDSRSQQEGQLLRSQWLAQGICAVGLFAILLVLLLQSASGILSLGAFVMFLQASQKALGNSRSLIAGLGRLYESGLHLKSLFDFLDLPLRRLAQGDQPFRLEKEIRFAGVSYQYPDRQTEALQSISCVIKKGESIGLVGFNGSGKTTFLKLLNALLEPRQGQILVDDTPLSQINNDNFQQACAAVYQDFSRYELSFDENIAPQGKPPDAQGLQSSLQAAGMWNSREALPNKGATALGRDYNDGIDLSRGEWQRLAIARALYRPAELLLFDEASSSLDPLAEGQLSESLKHLCKGRTAVLAAHRLKSIQWCDRIFVFDQGRIVEEGTHQQLLDAGGLYLRMVREQGIEDPHATF